MPNQKQIELLQDLIYEAVNVKVPYGMVEDFAKDYENAAWVDLRKEPENLPQYFEAVEVAAINENGECFECEALVTQRFSKSAVWRNGDLGILHNVIAWRPLPKFKE